MSFRSTTFAKEFTKRGFKIEINKDEEKIIFVFDSKKIDTSEKSIIDWMRVVESKVALGALDPVPYWGFQDLRNILGSKLKNCFYVIADRNIQNQHEFFFYKKLLVLSGFSFDKLLSCFEEGFAYIDFDARTEHNRGTKVRIKQQSIPSLYENVIQIDLVD